MPSILDKPENRVRLLKAGFTGRQIEWLYVHIFNDIEILDVDWLPEV